MTLLVQQLVLGLLIGGVYVAVGIGFSLVWGVLNIVNLAHGGLVIIGAYLTWLLFSAFKIDPFLSIPIVAAALFGIGYVLQRLLINRVIRAPIFFTLLLTFGVNLVIINVLLLLFKSDFRSVTPSYSGSGLSLGGVQLPYIRVAGLAVALLLAGAVALFLARSRVGGAIQAVGADRDAAQLVGVNLRHVYALTFGIGAACAGVAGGLISTAQAITPSAGEPYTLQAFVVVILGGLGRVSATVVGGLLFGVVETLAQTMVPGLGAGWANAIAFAILVVVLAVRPRGLMGRPV
ncbi:MAG: branched-chain amino acid ABC transporter permease [Candidatus Dormibacteraeota bacterium]|uniref:Branched-chain amino acid ABC transporter permease n=1 Tax=Candidatus Dormiibacter inghamiae TaxID=3127013 RepID=A0A934K967_9BACT|nr:branched-chain amino acid ABC transporter permease [Candidatus Dormibacteraeota bacterium]MBJ7604897.1 branched-chain amino acid ABC transporter permease [Candidatus Dormibacteraeota bacterium]